MFSPTPTQYFSQPCTPNPTFSTLFGQQQPPQPIFPQQSQMLPWGQTQFTAMDASTQQSPVGFNMFNVQQQTQPPFQGNFGQPNVFGQQVVQQPTFVQQPFQMQQQPIQYQFNPQQQQQPLLLQSQQPIIQSVLPVTYQHQLSPEVVFVPYVLDESGRISPKREGLTTWDKDMASFPEKYTRTSILKEQGRGPSILSTDPKYQSPVFDWGTNRYSGKICATGYSRDLLHTVTKLPGEQTAENGRRFLSMSDKIELDMLRNEVEILKARDFNNTINLRKKMSQPPPRLGLFDQPVHDDAWYDAWNRREAGPPKYNDDIDPITGKSLLEKLASPVNPRWMNRPVVDNSCTTRRFTSFDIHSPSSHTPNYERHAPSSTSTTSPLVTTLHRNCSPPGLMRFNLSQRLSQDMLPVYRPPRRLGGGDNNYVPNFGHGSVCGVILRSAKSYCIPPLQELDTLYSPITRKTVVRDFKVGHMDHGEVTFPGELNVTGLNLDAILQFSHKQLELYPNNHKKPAHGHELNRRAIVSLRNVFPKKATRLTGEPDPNYEQILKRACERFKGKFLNYNRFTGYWEFEIQNEPDDN